MVTAAVQRSIFFCRRITDTWPIDLLIGLYTIDILFYAKLKSVISFVSGSDALEAAFHEIQLRSSLVSEWGNSMTQRACARRMILIPLSIWVRQILAN